MLERLKIVLLLCGCLFALHPARALEPATYIGNAACARCHAEIARRYAQTPMAQSSGEVSQIEPGEFRHAAAGVRYRMTKEEGAAWLNYERGGAAALRGRARLHYFIGSGAAGRSFLFALERYLFQAPVTWYAGGKGWDVSPGYEADRELRFNRPIDANCLFCHASQTQLVYGSLNRYAEPPFKQSGISCERCHGPGSLHAQGAGPMVNPAKLDAERRDAVCAQCHLAGAARVELPGKRIAYFRAGERLAEYVSYFVFADAKAEGLKVNSHVEHLAQSVCGQRSGARMSCTSCHDPHSVPAATERIAYFRAKCLACHTTQSLPANAQHNQRANCIACHMPRARALDGGHGVMTDHSIPRRPRLPRASSPIIANGARQLAVFPGFTADARALGLAYAEVALQSGDKFHRSEARRLLLEVLPLHATDAELLTRLAFLRELEGETEAALKLYEAALRAEPERVPQAITAAVNAGGIYAARGELKRAIALWQDALRRNPGLREAALNLARAWQAQGETAKADEVLRQLRRFAPEGIVGSQTR